MRHFLAVVLALLMLASVAPGPLAAAPDRPPPNVVLVLVDDLGFSDLGCYGGEIETPNLDALAAGGLRFTQFYNTAKCAQTRATLLSGRYYPEVGTGRLTNCTTIAEGLRLRGYSTLMTGKWHLSGNPCDRGWDRYFGHLSGATNYFTGDSSFRLDREPFQVPRSGFYTTDANTDHAIRFLEESTEPGKPFFLYIAYNAPHYPFHAHRKDVEKYLGKYRKGWDALREERYRRMIEMGIIDRKWALSPRPDDVPAWGSLDPEKKREHDLTMSTYAAMIDRVDQNIGRLVGKLKRMGVFENTLFLFLSDNGACPFQRTRQRTRAENLRPWDPASYWTYDRAWAHACNTPFRLYKRNQHEGGISTPLIAHWPRGIRQGGAITHQVGHLVDILPTCLELAGVAEPRADQGRPGSPVRGRSLVPIFEGKQREPHDELYFLFGNRTHRALRRGDWKIVAHDRGAWELYNMRDDRTELRNLAATEPRRLQAMAKRWEELHREISGQEGARPRRRRDRRRTSADTGARDSTPARPSIVILLADDMGYSDLGCYGGEIETPNLDALARGGLRFTNFYTNNMCVPTRAALLTGVHHPLSYRGGTLSDRVVTIAELLREGGYRTAMAGKWHLSNDPGETGKPLERGFDRFYGTLLGASSFFAPASLMRDASSAEEDWRRDPEYYYTDAISDHAVQFVREVSAARPLFLYVAYTAAHWPLHAPEEDIARYRGRFDAGWDELRRRRHERMKELGVVNPGWPLSPRNPGVPAWEDAPHREWQVRRMEVYAAQVDRMDRGIGRIVDALRETGRLDNTLVLYLQDNGGCHVEYGPERKGAYLPERTRDGRPMRPGNLPHILPGPEDTYQSYGYGWANLSNTPFRLYKQHDHEGGIRTPLIAHWPAGIRQGGGRVTGAAHIVDFLPTCLELAGLRYPRERQGHTLHPLDGKSLVPLLRGGPRESHGALFWKFARGRAVRQGKWKLVSLRNQPWELYDIEADGTELDNLAAKMPGKVAALAELWEEWWQRSSPKPAKGRKEGTAAK